MWTLLIATFFINYNIIPDVPYLIKVDIFEQEYTIIRVWYTNSMYEDIFYFTG
jgi:hypothetical protein